MKKYLIGTLITFVCMSALFLSSACTDSDNTPQTDSDEHQLEHIEAVSPSCTEEGNIEYWHCSDCDKYFSDETAKNEITAESVVLEPLGHNYEDFVCTNCGQNQPFSKGLSISVHGDYCSVSGMGTCTDTDVRVPDYFEGKPVTKVQMNAFNYTPSLRSISLPDTVTTIGNGAFSDCTDLRKITLPDSIVTLGRGIARNTALYNTSSNWEGGFLYLGNYLISAEKATGECEIKDGVTLLADEACSESKLTGVTLPDSLKALPDSAFYGCENLKKVELPNTLEYIGHAAFSGCGKLEEISIPESVTSIENYAFTGCTSLKSVTLPPKITAIGEGIFASCSSLISVEIPADVASIEMYAFENCTSLQTVALPVSVTKIANYAFQGCSALTDIDLPDNIQTIQSFAFKDCTSLAQIDLPDSLQAISDSLFESCSSLENITINLNAKSIGSNAFKGCSALECITITSAQTLPMSYAFGGAAADIVWPSDYSLSKLYQRAFSGYLGTAIDLPDSITEIGEMAFSDCEYLKTVSLPSGLETIGERAFYNCIALETLTIPASVTSIGSNAFYLISADITWENNTSSLITIGEYVFAWYLGESLSLPNGIASIGTAAFKNCTALKSVSLPEGLEMIGSEAFANCALLYDIVLPSSVTQIADDAFSACDNLANIYYKGTQSDLDESLTASFPDSATVSYYTETMPTDSGNYWHFDEDGITPVKW